MVCCIPTLLSFFVCSATTFEQKKAAKAAVMKVKRKKRAEALDLLDDIEDVKLSEELAKAKSLELPTSTSSFHFLSVSPSDEVN